MLCCRASCQVTGSPQPTAGLPSDFSTASPGQLRAQLARDAGCWAATRTGWEGRFPPGAKPITRSGLGARSLSEGAAPHAI